MIKITNKLVRDNIPDIIISKGGNCDIEILDNKRFEEELIKKLKEEVSEFENDGSIEELADIYEVFLTILQNKNITLSDIKNLADEKRNKNGGFSKKIFMKSYNERGIIR